MAGLRNALRHVAEEKGEWCGIPMPLEGERLVVEPSYPYAGIGDIGKPDDNDDDHGLKLRGSFYSTRRRCNISVIETADGRITFGIEPAFHHVTMDLHTLGCADAWGIEQESNAVHTLAELVTHRQFKHYMLTGSFLERSARSDVMYMFRRLKPTVAIRTTTKQCSVLCTLCLHPIAHYAGTWAGAMCPTDDVIAHLMLMRGDEHMFWRRANQHPAHLPQSGL